MCPLHIVGPRPIILLDKLDSMLDQHQQAMGCGSVPSIGVNINPRSRGIGNDNTATASSSKTMKEKEKGPPLGLYAVWITPMPSQHEALAILSQLGDIEIGSAVLAETTAKGKDRKEKKAGGGKKATFKEYMPREATKPTTKCGNRSLWSYCCGEAG